MERYTVKAVADMAGVSVRTLHHYHHVGLLRPTSSTAAGYRLYSPADLERLQQVLFFRELGFPLHEIKAIVDSPTFDRGEALRAHRQLLVARRDRLGQLVELVDRTIDEIEKGRPMANEERFAGFDDPKLAEYREEARQRWGHTDAYKESSRRAASYTKVDWAAIQAENSAINDALAGLMDREPADPEVQGWVARHHRQIDERFYKCSAEIYRGLANMYVDDPRFTATYDAVKPGLAKFLREAMLVYADTIA